MFKTSSPKLKKYLNFMKQNWDILLTIILTLSAFLYLFGTGVLDINNTSFLWGSIDLSVTYQGSVFFRLDEWRWPLFVHQNLMYPYGISVYGTDGGPLFSLIGKILYKLSLIPARAQLVGWWTLAVYVLQAYVSVLIFRHAFKNKWLVCVSALFFVSSPIMLYRIFEHINLMAHFVLLFAILLWLNNRLESKEKFYMFVLITLAFWTCPYFLPMQIVFFAALIYQKVFIDKDVSKKSATLLCFGLAFWSLFLFYLSGQSHTGQKMSVGGWETYGLNLATFFCPTWSKANFFQCSMPHDIYGKFDGDNYFGLGVFLLFILFFYAVKELFNRKNIRKNWVFSLLLIGLTLFSLSPKIRYIDFVIMEYNPGKYIRWLGDAFRFSGRLFWPIWYLLVYFLLKTAGKVWGKKAIFILPLFLLVQLWDLSPMFKEKHDYYNQMEKYDLSPKLISQEWEKLAQKYDKVFAFGDDYREGWAWAIEYNKKVNFGYLNRPNPMAERDAERVEKLIMNGYVPSEYKDSFFILPHKTVGIICESAKNNPQIQKLYSKIQKIDDAYVLECDSDLIYNENEVIRFIPVVHRFWTSSLAQIAKNRLYRDVSNSEKDYAQIIKFDDEELIVKWDKWGIEKFKKGKNNSYFLK